jgi:S1-C subfamily serine protease
VAPSTLLDLVLVVVLLAYLVHGLRAGLLRSVFPILGAILGGAAGVFVIPLLGGIVPDPNWRTVAALAVLLILLVGGSGLGSVVGRIASGTLARGPLRIVDRAAGGVVVVVVAALVTSMVLSLGVPLLSAPVAGSAVLRTIDDLTPAPVRAALAQFRSLVVTDGIPQIAQALGAAPAQVPQVDTGNPALQTAARSVVRITGNAYACGQSQTGSGFVVAPGRVLTNAHVVAGVDEPVVETPADGAAGGRVVYFDPVDDLAVIAVDGLTTAPLALSAELPQGSQAVVEGYPFGGPFSAKGAQVISVGSFDVQDIYNSASASRSVYTLAADVEQGNSGGPLLALDGTVAGLVFAKNATTADVGYAMTLEEVGPVAAAAPALDAQVSAGTCTSG